MNENVINLKDFWEQWYDPDALNVYKYKSYEEFIDFKYNHLQKSLEESGLWLYKFKVMYLIV